MRSASDIHTSIGLGPRIPKSSKSWLSALIKSDTYKTSFAYGHAWSSYAPCHQPCYRLLSRRPRTQLLPSVNRLRFDIEPSTFKSLAGCSQSRLTSLRGGISRSRSIGCVFSTPAHSQMRPAQFLDGKEMVGAAQNSWRMLRKRNVCTSHADSSSRQDEVEVVWQTICTLRMLLPITTLQRGSGVGTSRLDLR